MRRYGMEDWQTANIPFNQHSYDDLYREILDAKIRTERSNFKHKEASTSL